MWEAANTHNVIFIYRMIFNLVFQLQKAKSLDLPEDSHKIHISDSFSLVKLGTQPQEIPLRVTYT